MHIYPIQSLPIAFLPHSLREDFPLLTIVLGRVEKQRLIKASSSAVDFSPIPSKASDFQNSVGMSWQLITRTGAYSSFFGHETHLFSPDPHGVFR